MNNSDGEILTINEENSNIMVNMWLKTDIQQDIYLLLKNKCRKC